MSPLEPFAERVVLVFSIINDYLAQIPVVLSIVYNIFEAALYG
jgi:hypothetical protein